MSAASERLGYERAGRGAPPAEDGRWDAETARAARIVAATWRVTVKPDGNIGRLRMAMTRHAPMLLALFGKGARVSRFARVLIEEGVTLDNGSLPRPRALLNSWVRTERALAKRVEGRGQAA